jgi:hypothetical protein
MHVKPVDGLQASGRYTFRREKAVSALGVSAIALRIAALRPAGAFAGSDGSCAWPDLLLAAGYDAVQVRKLRFSG